MSGWPAVGSKWVSLDPRDEQLVVTVIGVTTKWVQIQWRRTTLVRHDRFARAYRPALSLEDDPAASDPRPDPCTHPEHWTE